MSSTRPVSTTSPRRITSDALRHARDHAHVVGDQRHRRVRVAAQILDQIEHLRLHGGVERRGRLVGDQQRRLGHHRHGDHHALAHAAGEFVRILRRAAAPPRECARAPAIRWRAGARLGAGDLEMVRQHLAHLRVDGQVRGQRGQRILEHEGDVAAAELVELAARQRPALRGRWNFTEPETRALSGGEAEGGEEGLALARAALADDAEALALGDGERHALAPPRPRRPACRR